jgi:TolA-binding protein
MAWDPAASMLGQSAYIDALRREGDEEAAVAEMWRLAESYPAVADDGMEVHNSVFNAPMATVRQTLQSGGDADAEIERALDYYEEVRTSYPARVPALLADLHRASLYDIRGDWRRSAEVLGEVLEAYPDSVLRPAEGSRVAFTLGRLLATEERDVAGAVEAFERARTLAPGSSTAWDATLALGEYHASVRDYDRAVELFEAVYEGDPDDRSRAPRAMLSQARALETAGRWDDARNAFSELQAAYPDSPQSREAPFLIAAHYRRTGEDDLADSILRRAEEDLRATIREEGTSNEGLTAYRYLFDILIEREEWEQAAREMGAFAEVFEGRPEAALALLQAAQIARERLRDDGRAVGYLERVEDGYPQTAFAERAKDMRSQLTN